MNDAQRARRRAIVALRGLTFAQIAERCHITRQRAWQLWREETWPTDVAEAKRAETNLWLSVKCDLAKGGKA